MAKKLKTRIFLFVDEVTGEMWSYVYEGEGEPVVIEVVPKLRKLSENGLQKDDDELVH